jgi:hypothetical protein
MSNTPVSSIAAPGALIKPKRERIKKTEAFSMKPPLVEADPEGGDNHKYLCKFVSNNYREVKQVCTFDVWKRCEGRQTPGRVRDGLDSRLHNDFVIIQDGEDKVIDIDIIPKTYYASKAVLPDNLQGKEDIILKVNSKTGGVEITQCPAGVNKAKILKLISSLDAVTSVSTGDTLSGGFEVLNVSGNQVSVVSTARN